MSLVQYCRISESRTNIIWWFRDTAFQTAYSDTVSDDKLKKESRKVVETLDRLALIVTDSVYIRETLCMLKEYLELYQRRQKEVLEYLSKHTSTNYRYTVYTIWQVSLNMIESYKTRSWITCQSHWSFPVSITTIRSRWRSSTTCGTIRRRIRWRSALQYSLKRHRTSWTIDDQYKRQSHCSYHFP